MNKRAAHDNLLLAADVMGLVISVYVLYRLIPGDVGKLFRMRATRFVSHFSKGQADFWTGMAAKADTHYWQITNV